MTQLYITFFNTIPWSADHGWVLKLTYSIIKQGAKNNLTHIYLHAPHPHFAKTLHLYKTFTKIGLANPKIDPRDLIPIGHLYWNTTTNKILRVGFYWTNLFYDVYKTVMSFHEYQIFQGKRELLPLPLQSISIQAPLLVVGSWSHWWDSCFIFIST